MANEVEKVNGIAITSIANINGKTDDNIEKLNGKEYAGSVPYITATGGSITTDGDYKVHTFTSSGTFEVTTLGTGESESDKVDFLIIGGGGSGGSGYNKSSSYTLNGVTYAGEYGLPGGGGGAGGYNGGGLTGDGTPGNPQYSGWAPVKGAHGGGGGGCSSNGSSNYYSAGGGGTGIYGKGTDGAAAQSQNTPGNEYDFCGKGGSYNPWAGETNGLTVNSYVHNTGLRGYSNNSSASDYANPGSSTPNGNNNNGTNFLLGSGADRTYSRAYSPYTQGQGSHSRPDGGFPGGGGGASSVARLRDDARRTTRRARGDAVRATLAARLGVYLRIAAGAPHGGVGWRRQLSTRPVDG